MKRIKKVSCLIICVVLAGYLFAACSKLDTRNSPLTGNSLNTGTSKITGKITFSSNRTDFQNTLFHKYVEEFNRIYPNVTVTVETIKYYQNTIKIKMASNSLPDIWTVHDGSYSKDILARYNIALDKLNIASDFNFTEPFKGNDGKIYGLPTGISYTGVVYNKKIFDDLGLKVPSKLAELIDSAQKISHAGKVGFATAAKAGWPLQYYWLDIPKMISGDPEVRNKLADSSEPFTNDNAVVKSYKILKRLSDAKILEKDPLWSDWEPIKKEFRAGNVGMILLGPWFVPQVVGEALQIDDVGFFPFPYDEGTGPKNTVGGPDVALAISKSSRYPEAAEAFFKFMMNDKYADFAKQCGLLSARKSIEVDLPFAKEFMSYRPNIIPAVGDSQEIQDIINNVQFDYFKLGQEVLMGKDINGLFEDLNAKWKKVKK